MRSHLRQNPPCDAQLAELGTLDLARRTFSLSSSAVTVFFSARVCRGHACLWTTMRPAEWRLRHSIGNGSSTMAWLAP